MLLPINILNPSKTGEIHVSKVIFLDTVTTPFIVDMKSQSDYVYCSAAP
jgi:hypothetical protein